MDRRIHLILNEISPDDEVLDVGCIGYDADNAIDDHGLHKFICQKAKYTAGIDIIPDEVRKLQEKGFNVTVASAENFHFDMKFDAIIAGGLIEHLSNPGKFLDRAREHLKDGGKLMLTTPNPWSLLPLLAIGSGRLSLNEEHVCWYDKTTLRQLLKSHGFKLTKVEFYPSHKAGGLTRFIQNSLSLPLYWFGLKSLGGDEFLAVSSPH